MRCGGAGAAAGREPPPGGLPGMPATGRREGVTSWGGDHPDGPEPLGIPGLRSRRRQVIFLACWLFLAGFVAGGWLVYYLLT